MSRTSLNEINKAPEFLCHCRVLFARVHDFLCSMLLVYMVVVGVVCCFFAYAAPYRGTYIYIYSTFIYVMHSSFWLLGIASPRVHEHALSLSFSCTFIFIFVFLPFYCLILYSLVCFFIYIQNNNIQFHLRFEIKIHSYIHIHTYDSRLTAMYEKKTTTKGTKSRIKWIKYIERRKNEKKTQSAAKKSMHKKVN